MKSTVDLVGCLVKDFSQTPEVLIADCDTAFCSIFKNLLERLGCHVSVCNKVSECIDSIAAHIDLDSRLDIVFLDINIPETNGVDILKKLKEKMPSVPVIIVTGNEDNNLIQEALKYGFLGLVEKPINLEEISMIFKKHRISFQ